MLKFINSIKEVNPNSIISKIIREYFYLIKQETNYFKNWKTFFINLHGNLDSQRRTDFNLINKKYNINIDSKQELFKFVFCLQIFYVNILKKISEKKISELKVNKIRVLNYGVSKRYEPPVTSKNLEKYNDELIDIINGLDYKNVELDYIKQIYENLIPNSIRHSMGEFYTPDWLSKIILGDFLKKHNNLENKYFLDPTCGAGTFLFNLFNEFKDKGVDLDKVCGFDINPIAILAAKTNYLFLIDNNERKKEILIPFFNVDLTKNPDFYNKQKKIKFNPSKIKEKYKSFLKNSKSLKNIDENFLNLKNFDYILGNPPMVNWEYLPKDFRDKTINIWQNYQLFDYKGLNSIFIKEDISSLITYISADKYLKNKGYLSFILKESLIKSPKQASGFRKFKFQHQNKTTNFCPYKINDFTNINAFKNVAVKIISLNLQKNLPIKFPINCDVWKKSSSNKYKIFNKILLPIIKNNPSSNWLTTEKESQNDIYNFLGKCSYKARTGLFSGGANAIFYLNILDKKNDLLLIKNINERAKNKVKEVKKFVEKDLIYPLILGRDLKQWNYKYSQYVILPHTSKSKMYPIEYSELKKHKYTKEYFDFFKKDLKARKGFTSFDKHIHEKYFYAMQRIGEYTFSKYKVAWKYIASEFTTCVISSRKDKYLGNKNLIPNEKIIFIPFENKTEAYFVCGFLSSTVIRNLINSFISRIQISPSTIENVKIPDFDKNNKYHLKISELCEIGHNKENKKEILKKIDFYIKYLDN